jgi:hypothetical protein
MRDLSAGPLLLSVNTATVRKQAGLLEIIEACARHGIAAISPWRDQVAAVGLDRAARAIKDAGLKLSGYCRGGLFPATGEHVMAARDDNRRAVDEAAALGAPCVILVAIHAMTRCPWRTGPHASATVPTCDRRSVGSTAATISYRRLPSSSESRCNRTKSCVEGGCGMPACPAARGETGARSSGA